MGLNPRVGCIVHQMQESGNDPVVELLLEDGGEVRRHLTEGVATGEADSRVLKKQKPPRMKTLPRSDRATDQLCKTLSRKKTRICELTTPYTKGKKNLARERTTK